MANDELLIINKNQKETFYTNIHAKKKAFLNSLKKNVSIENGELKVDNGKLRIDNEELRKKG